MRGIRHSLWNFSATAVEEHLRSEIEATGGSPDLTKTEIELMRFIHDGSFDWRAFLAKRSGGYSRSRAKTISRLVTGSPPAGGAGSRRLRPLRAAAFPRARPKAPRPSTGMSSRWLRSARFEGAPLGREHP